eukprot:1018924-Pleurochrysis_carterae.AAC.1
MDVLMTPHRFINDIHEVGACPFIFKFVCVSETCGSDFAFSSSYLRVVAVNASGICEGLSCGGRSRRRSRAIQL